MRDMNKYVADFDDLPFEHIQTKYRKKKFLQNLRRFHHVESALEVGCGDSSIFEKVKFKENYLIEPVKEFSDRLASKINTSDIVIENSLLENSTLAKTFDLVVLSCVLHEVSNPDEFFSKAISYLNENGIVYVDVPNAYSLHRYFAVATGHLNSIHDHTTTQKIMQQSNLVFSEASLCEYFHKFGLHVIDSGGYFIKPFHHGRMQSLIDAGQFTDADLDGFYEMGEALGKFGSEIYAIGNRKIDK